MGYRTAILAVVATAVFAVSGANGADGPASPEQILTHADAAVILAKHSGYFDRYVDKEADLQACITFLNQQGVYFGLMEIVNKAEFTREDCARAMGQIDLILSGHAELLHGKVKLPKDIVSWSEFCIMHGVRYVEGYEAMRKIVRLGGRLGG